jgi:hypothetical protein
MNSEELLSKSRWEILKELSKGDRSASELAKKTGQSTANMANQLKILEAYSIIKKAKPEETKRKAGKPKTPYALSQDLIVAGVLRPGFADKRVMKCKDLDDFQKLALNGFFMLESHDNYCLLKVVCQSDLIKKADLIAFLKSNEHELELFIITEHLHDVREKYSTMNVESFDGQTKKVISWSHNKKEVEEGLARQDEYFLHLVKNSKGLLDKKGVLEELKAL